MASNGIIDFDGKQIYVPEWALDDSVQTLVGISQSILNNLSRQTKLETDSQGEQRKSNDTNARLLRDISNNTAESKRSNQDFKENSKRLMSTFTSSRNSFVATQNAMDSLTNLSSNLGSRIEELRGKVADTGLSFESYAAMIVKNNDIMKRFGTDLVDGSNNFAALSKSIRESIGDSARYGVSVETLNQMILDEIDIRIRAGQTQEEINAELATGFRRTIDTVTALSVATDTAVEDIVDATRRLKSSDAVRTFIEAGTIESRRLEAMLPGLTAIFSSLGDIGNTLVAGIVESVATNTDVMAYENGRIADILNTGGTELADNFVTLVDFMKTALSSGIQGVEEADLATSVLSNLSSGLAVMGEEVAKNKDILETASEAGNKNAEQLISLGVATQGMSQNFTMFSRTLARAQTEVTETFDRMGEASSNTAEKVDWLASFLSRQFARPDSEGRVVKVGTVEEELSNLIDRFNRAMDNREQYKEVKFLSALLERTADSVAAAFSSIMRGDLSGMVSSLMNSIERVVDKISGSIPFIGPMLGAAAGVATFMVGTIVGATEEYAKVLQSMVGVGAGIGTTLEDMRTQAANLGMDLQSLANVVSSNSRAMLAFGTNINDGSRNFLAMGERVKANTSLMNQYGYSNTELLEILAEEAEVRRLSGQTAAGLDTSLEDLIFETTAVASLTGVQRRELLRERQTQAKEGIFSGFLSTLEPEIASRLTSVVSTMSSVLPKPFADAFRDAVSTGMDIRNIPEYQEFFKLIPADIRDQFYSLYDSMRSGYKDTSVSMDELNAKLITTGGQIGDTFDEFMKTPTGEALRIQARFNSELTVVFTEFQKLRGLPTDFAEAIAKLEELKKNIEDQKELKLASSIEDLAQAMKASVLLTAMNTFGFDSGQIIESISKMDELFKGEDGKLLPVDQAIVELAKKVTVAENDDTLLTSAIKELTASIMGEDGLIKQLGALAIALGAYGLLRKSPGLLAGGAALLGGAAAKAGSWFAGTTIGSAVLGAGAKLLPYAKMAGRVAIPGAAAAIGVAEGVSAITDDTITAEKRYEEVGSAIGSTILGGLGAGIAGYFTGGLGAATGGAAGIWLGDFLGGLAGKKVFEWFGPDTPEISGGAGDAEVAGSAGADILGTTISQTTEELMLASQLNSRLDSLLTKYDEEIEILKTQNQILIDTMARVMETNRILENYVRVYKENVM